MAAAGVVAVFFESACGLCRGPDRSPFVRVSLARAHLSTAKAKRGEHQVADEADQDQ